MRITGISGTYLARALITNDEGWFLCGCFHIDKNDAVQKHSATAQWPVEVVDGIAYIPSEEEMRDEK